MLTKDDKVSLASITAAVVTTAAFAKLFLPFYLIGSTAIFAATSAIGAALIVIGWRSIYQMGSKVGDILLLLAALYGLVIVNFLSLSRPIVPMTHLLGILIFHSLFMIFGFAAARSPRTVLMLLLGAGAFYLMAIALYAVRFGDVMQNGSLHDIFGVGYRLQPELYGDQPVPVYAAFHQKIGILLALAALAALGLASNRIARILAIGAVPLVLLLMFHIAARGALVAFICSLIFLMGAGLWIRSRKLALLSVIAAIAVAMLASGIFYEYALHDKDIDPMAPDAISRTIREIQEPKPGLRQQIWTDTWHRISDKPNRLLFGRGIGMYPVDEGVGAPDWLLHRTKASEVYPHNVHLEMLYETGIVGLLLYTVLTLFPLVIALKRWHVLSLAQKSVVSMYVFYIVGSEFSGSFGFSYLDQFFFALTVGIIALKRTEDALVASLPPSRETLDSEHPAKIVF
jgi:O-antigen ligase